MQGSWARTRACVIISIFALAGPAVFGQELPGRIAGGSAPQVVLNMRGDTSYDVVSDVFFGKDSGGPYNLTWRGINRFTDTVSVDDKFLSRDFDYFIDYAAGTISFVSSIASKSVIRVEYSCDPTVASKNTAPFNVPITLDLMKKETRALQFTGLYRQADSNARSAADVLVYGLTGGAKGKEGEVSSMFLFSPERPGDTDSSMGERSAIRVGGTTKTDTLELRTSYLRVGEQFAGSKDYQLQHGTDTLDLSAVLTPTDSLRVSSAFKRTELLAGDKKGETVASAEHKIVLSPDGAPRLTAVRSEISKERPGIDDQKTTTDRLQLEHQLGQNVSAVATHESVSKEVGGTGTTLTTNQLAMTAKPSESLAIQGKLAQKDSSIDGEETSLALNVDATPSKIVSIKGGMTRSDSEKTGETNTESLKLMVDPNENLKVQMDMKRTDTSTAGEELAHNLRVISTPVSALRLELGMSGRRMDRPGDEWARGVKLSTTAVSRTSIGIDWSQKDSELSGAEEFGGIRVETKPTETVRLTGALSERETTEDRVVSKEAGVQVQPFSHTTVGGAYREITGNSGMSSRVSEVSATTKPSDFIQLAGAYKARETAGQDDLDSLNVSLQLDTGGFLKFTGGYITNPEDKKGVVQRMNSQTIGLRTDFGRLKLTGAYTMNDQYIAGIRGETTEIGMDLRLSDSSMLTTGYTLDEMREASIRETTIYTLGFSRRVGNRLNLYVGGKRTAYENEAMFGMQSEYEAEARLGLKF